MLLCAKICWVLVGLIAMSASVWLLVARLMLTTEPTLIDTREPSRESRPAVIVRTSRFALALNVDGFASLTASTLAGTPGRGALVPVIEDRSCRTSNGSATHRTRE